MVLWLVGIAGYPVFNSGVIVVGVAGPAEQPQTGAGPGEGKAD